MQSMNRVGKHVASNPLLVEPEANVYWTHWGSEDWDRILEQFLLFRGKMENICKPCWP